MTVKRNSPPVVEKFVEKFCAEASENILAASFLPWNDNFSIQPVKGRVLFPPPGSDMFVEEDIEQAVFGKEAVFFGCTFGNPEEEAAARRMLPQFERYQNLGKVVMHLWPSEDIDASCMMDAYDRMYKLGVDDIVLEPDWNEPQAMHNSVMMTVTALDASRKALEVFAGKEGVMLEETIEAIQSQHQHLLWESIARNLMPQLPVCERTLVENEAFIGQCRLDENMTKTSNVHAAFDTSNGDQRVAIKVIPKDTIFTAVELESIYREFRFVTERLSHPNITKGLKIMHSSSKLYLKMEFAGARNLEAVLQDCPDQRLQQHQIFEILKQIAAGLAFCHSQDVVHRNLALKHVVAQERPDGYYDIKLCDFRNATIAPASFISSYKCGQLPYIAPEVISGAYKPAHADNWSVGIILLEMGAGLGSTFKAVNHVSSCSQDEEIDFKKLLLQAFENKGDAFYAHAWTCTGAEDSKACYQVLASIMQIEPELRGNMKSTLQRVGGIIARNESLRGEDAQ